jgi:hypothetical protein
MQERVAPYYYGGAVMNGLQYIISYPYSLLIFYFYFCAPARDDMGLAENPHRHSLQAALLIFKNILQENAVEATKQKGKKSKKPAEPEEQEKT